ncbi:death effector domain-containing protein isoform X3 [Ahaetulla prasina]|uniref:death effector domain-containing protein isoform X3 n=1 Tax=Ahaetulla prasina TaxID=499056 RepID=UPI00264872D7|nr:death effector domain-containing protein isoform X3 [Ahaetulla prasina]
MSLLSLSLSPSLGRRRRLPGCSCCCGGGGGGGARGRVVTGGRGAAGPNMASPAALRRNMNILAVRHRLKYNSRRKLTLLRATYEISLPGQGLFPLKNSLKICVFIPDPLCLITYARHGQAGISENNKEISAPGEGDPPSPQFPWMLGGRGRFSPSLKMATLKRNHQQAWPEEEGDREHGLYSLHRMFDIVGTHLTHRDVRVLSFLFVDVIDDYERGMIRSGRDFLLALERQGRCDETNFRQVLQLLRIITRHDLLPYVTLKRRKAVCPDLVDKYLEETSIRYVTPRAHSNTEHVPVHQHKSDIRLRVRAEYCQHETALEGNVFSNKQDPLERQFERFSQANTILKSRDLGSIICDIKFSELTYLDAFWRDYINGSLLEALKGVFITDSLKQAVGHEAIKLLVNVDEEDYEVGRQKLLRNLMLQTAP